MAETDFFGKRDPERRYILGIPIVTVEEYDEMKKKFETTGVPDDLGLFYVMGTPFIFEGQAKRLRWAIKVIERMANIDG